MTRLFALLVATLCCVATSCTPVPPINPHSSWPGHKTTAGRVKKHGTAHPNYRHVR